MDTKMNAFDWSKYLELAAELAKDDTDEAKLRTAISRAYYAAFHAAREDAMRRLQQKAPRFQTHRWTINFYAKSNRRIDRKIGRKLKRLKKSREMADYDPFALIDLNFTQASLEEAQLIKKWILN